MNDVLFWHCLVAACQYFNPNVKSYDDKQKKWQEKGSDVWHKNGAGAKRQIETAKLQKNNSPKFKGSRLSLGKLIPKITSLVDNPQNDLLDKVSLGFHFLALPKTVNTALSIWGCRFGPRTPTH